MMVYEHLEQKLTKFELEEEEEIKQIMNASFHSSDEAMSDILSSKKKGEIKISQQNIFNNFAEGGPKMTS